ncbi:hypothetical protein M413DRAFT_19982 [Hebeloma cylindrosporum]|uniref:Cytochrome P450 n=1 Tax=Hebeloma cylindrosporum TaxID=76867 RepID=A0A0C3C3C5_HEBCY|nr:hypothetical protein M413DRAFT_19982 [Hebeloma cylindrosporum h7]
MTISQALCELAERPKYIQPLREEVDSVLANEGWTKASIGQLYKLDSFFREHRDITVVMSRYVMKDFTFSDGTCVPAGTHLCVNARGNHRDDAHYPSANTFDGFRFAHEDGVDQPLTVTPTLDYNAFGNGRPTCPGRFFAVAELKVMLAHILSTYDGKLKFGNEGVAEQKQIPNPKEL